MANFINSWGSGNKKNKYNLIFRLGKITIFEFNLCPCNDEGCNKFRFILLNIGFEL